MCGIFFIKSENPHLIKEVLDNHDHVFKKLIFRGPDHTSVKEVNEKTLIIHFLLAINNFIPQPLKKDDKYLWFNGEIYDYPTNEFRNDAEYLLDFLSDTGLNNLDKLDGEFCICYLDEEKQKMHLISDPFATKPCSFYMGNDTFIVSSYESCIKNINPLFVAEHIEPNTHYVFDLNSYTLDSKKEIVQWDFEPRYNTFDHWIKSFKDSIKKRSQTDKKIFVPLSAGHDSGLIVSELLNQNIDFRSYTFKGVEDKQILESRLNLIDNHQIVDPKQNFISNFAEYYHKIENYYAHHYNGERYMDIYDAYSCFAIYLINRHARENGYLVALSGHGADEIFSDYSTQTISALRGNYKGVRSKWPNFDSGYGRNIINMFERVGGACSVEVRYPFLDKHVVQNFLWLSDDLKNKEYKQCLSHLLRVNKFPYIQKKSRLSCFEDDLGNQTFKKITAAFYNQYKIKKEKFRQESSKPIKTETGYDILYPPMVENKLEPNKN